MITTVSLETAKLLKEAGYEQESAIYWKSKYLSSVEYILLLWKNEDGMASFNRGKDTYASPTTDELLEYLPYEINIPYKNGKKRKQEHSFSIRRWNNTFHVRYYANAYNDNPHFSNDSLPEALAQMWLWLNKENLIS